MPQNFQNLLRVILFLAALVSFGSGAGNYNKTNSEAHLNEQIIKLLNSNFGYVFIQFITLKLERNDSENGNEELAMSTRMCLYQLRELLNGFSRKDTWAIKLIDSWGKIPSGLLYGNMMNLGNFEECLNIKTELSLDNTFNGKYCLSNIPVTIETEINLRIGICIPAVCDAEQFNKLFEEFLESYFDLGFTSTPALLNESDCKQNVKVVFRALDWVAIGLLILLALLIICSTVYDYMAKYFDKSGYPIFITFSLRTNMRQLFHISNSPQLIPCLCGIRAMSIIWIVFGHGYLFGLLSPNINTVEIIEWVQSPFSMFLQTGTISVDSFFFLSGLLLMMIALKEMKKNEGKLNVILMYVHRYLRLTPVLAVAVLLFMTLFRYVGNGPLWNNFTGSSYLCEETWWATLLYIQNYAAAGKMCLGHSWYLAVDTQLYIISPLILIAIWKWQKKGIAALLIFGLLLVVCLFTIIVIEKFSFLDIGRNLGEANDAMSKIYYSTQTRASPWIIGIVFGYYLYNNNNRKIILSNWTIASGWILSLSLLFTVIFSIYAKMQQDAPPLSPLENALYISLSRIAWPLALCWIVFACVNGIGGPVNIFLSWSLWQPISKISYCMYIFHLIVINVNAGRIKTNTYFSDYDMMLTFWADFGITLFVSTCFYLAVEAPMIGIEKLILPKKQPQRQRDVAEMSNPTKISQQKLCQ